MVKIDDSTKGVGWFTFDFVMDAKTDKSYLNALKKHQSDYEKWMKKPKGPKPVFDIPDTNTAEVMIPANEKFNFHVRSNHIDITFKVGDMKGRDIQISDGRDYWFMTEKGIVVSSNIGLELAEDYHGETNPEEGYHFIDENEENVKTIEDFKAELLAKSRKIVINLKNHIVKKIEDEITFENLIERQVDYYFFSSAIDTFDTGEECIYDNAPNFKVTVPKGTIIYYECDQLTSLSDDLSFIDITKAEFLVPDKLN